MTWNKCEWKWTDEYFKTACGKAFFFDCGNIAENNFRFCPYCGRRIYEKDLEKETKKKEV